MKKSLYIAVFLLLFLCVAVVVAATSLFCLYPKDHRETVSKYARERGIDERSEERRVGKECRL